MKIFLIVLWTLSAIVILLLVVDRMKIKTPVINIGTKMESPYTYSSAFDTTANPIVYTDEIPFFNIDWDNIDLTEMFKGCKSPDPYLEVLIMLHQQKEILK